MGSVRRDTHAGDGLPPILELLYLSPIVAVLALVIPRFPLGRERILLVGDCRRR